MYSLCWHPTSYFHQLEHTCYNHLSPSFYYTQTWQHILMNSNVQSLYLLCLLHLSYFCIYANMLFIPWLFLRFSKMKLELIAFLIAWNMVYCVWVCVPMWIWLYGCAHHRSQLYSDLITVTCVRGSWMFSHFLFSINMLFDVAPKPHCAIC